MLLSIILVNYRSGQLLYDCLHSIFEQTKDIAFEIILVDNSADDGLVEKVKHDFPLVQAIDMGYNAGFARANNAGIEIAKGDAVLLLNTDTIIKENAISESFKRLMDKPGYVACGVQLQYADGTPQISGNYNLTGGLNFLMTIPYVGRVLRSFSLLLGVQKPSIEEVTQTEKEVDWINGAYMMVKQTAIEKAGKLDPDFFLYHEEPEWCGRLQKQGRLCIFGDLHVTHLEGASANAAFGTAKNDYSNLGNRKGFQLLISMLVRLRKQFGVFWFFFHFLFHSFSILLVLPLGILHAVITGSKAILVDAVGYCANVLKTWPYYFTILLNKPCFYKVL